MLGKLIKYDLMYSWKIFTGMMAALLLWGIIGYPSNSNVVITLNVVLLPVMLAAGVLCVVSVLRYYSRSLFGKQGYLTMTLPTTPLGILASKTITTTIWFNAVLVVGLLSVGLYTRELGNMLEYLTGYLPDILRSWLTLNLNMLSALLGIYMAITLSNISIRGRRLGFWGGLAGYILWAILQNVVNRILSSVLYHTYSMRYTAVSVQLLSGLTSSGSWWHLGAAALFAACAFVITWQLLRRRVNLP